MPRPSPTTKFDLKAAREQRGMSQTAAAELLHTSQPSIARWESGEFVPLIVRKYWEIYWHTQDNEKRKSKQAPKAANSETIGTALDIPSEYPAPSTLDKPAPAHRKRPKKKK